MGFHLKTLPNTPFGPLRCYANQHSAIAHLNKHLLSAPESEIWRILIEEYEQVVGPRDDDRFHFAKRMLKHPYRAKPLYDLYVDAVEAALNDAAELGWHASPGGGESVAIGLTGIVLFVTTQETPSILRTAFLPNQHPAPLAKHQDDCTETPLCRERSDSAIKPQKTAVFSGRKQALKARKKRHKKRTRTERIYFEAFRPAKRFVRKSHYKQSNPSKGGKPSGEASLLLDPIRSSLDDAEHDLSRNKPPTSPNYHINFERWFHLWKRSPNNDKAST